MPMVSIAECLRVTELLAARVCHDLSGSIGAIATALDIVKLHSPAHSEALTLADDAAGEAIARLRLLRAAWGIDPGDLSLAEVQALASGLPSARRVRIDWSALPHDAVFSAPAGQLLLNMLMMASESIPDAGTIMLTGTSEDLFIRPVSPRAAWPARLSAALADSQVAMEAFSTSHNLQMPLTVLLARSANIDLTMLIGTGSNDKAPPLRMECRPGA
jgi:histidine phosphotransferase ChpT